MISINDDVLTVSGKLIKTDLESVWVCCGGIGDPIPVSSGRLFSVSVPLYALTDKSEVTIYTKVTADDVYWSYSWREIYVEKNDGNYCFVESLVLDHNIVEMSAWKKAENYLSRTLSEEMVQLSNEIVGSEIDEYRKLYLLNYWVADNIFYDFDYFYSNEGVLYTNAEDVYGQGRSVCAGYANLLQTLVQAQGIPCKQAYTYSVGDGTIGYFNESNCNIASSNHAHVEAYIDGRWVIMDPTWDSNNRYEDGEYHYKEPTIRFFDVTLDYLSFSHKIISR